MNSDTPYFSKILHKVSRITEICQMRGSIGSYRRSDASRMKYGLWATRRRGRRLFTANIYNGAVHCSAGRRLGLVRVRYHLRHTLSNQSPNNVRRRVCFPQDVACSIASWQPILVRLRHYRHAHRHAWRLFPIPASSLTAPLPPGSRPTDVVRRGGEQGG